MRLRRLAATLVLCLAVSCAAAGTAAAGWSAPRVVDAAGGFRQGFSASGDLLFTGDFNALRVLRVSGGAFGAPAPVFSAPASEMIFEVGADGADAATILTLRRHKPYPRVRIAMRSADGTLSAPRTISGRGHAATQPDLAVAADGTAIAGWGWHDSGGWRVQVAVRLPGQPAFGPAQNLSDPDAGSRPWVTVAAGDGGHAAVTWHDGGSYQQPSEELRATTLGADGSFGPAVLLDSGAGFYETALSVAADGRALAAWAPTYYLSRGDTEPGVLKAADAAPGARFGTARTLSTGGPGFLDQGGPVADVAADGRAVVAWGKPVAARHTRGVVEVFARAAGGDFGPAQVLSDGTRSPSGLTLSSGGDGTIALGWADAHFAAGYSGPNWESRVAVRRPSDPQFAAAVRVSDAAHNGLWPTVRVGRGGEVMAAWVFNDDGSGGGTIAAATLAR